MSHFTSVRTLEEKKLRLIPQHNDGQAPKTEHATPQEEDRKEGTNLRLLQAADVLLNENIFVSAKQVETALAGEQPWAICR